MSASRGRRACAWCLSGLLLFASAPPALAQDAPAATGWWWAGRPTGELPAVLPPVAGVPEGGLFVESGAAGPSGVSALRYELDGQAGALTLTVAEAVGTPVIQACAPVGAWEPEEGGGWDRRPEADCATTAAGVFDAEAKTVTFAVGALQRDDVLDLVLLPAAPAEGAPAEPFSVSFESPGTQALRTSTAGTPTSPPAWQDTTPPVTQGSPPLSGGFGGLGGFEEPVAPGEAPLAAPPTSAPTVSVPVPMGPPILGDDGFAYAGVVALPLLFLAGAAYVGWALTRPVAVPRVVVRRA